ncbi:MAG: cytidine deaminase [Actinobacteria bacterium]|nr:MAG: cytidine deaminase [Actinomycetota bacterium]
MSNIDELYESAVKAQKQAYCPYSHYPVGAALRTVGGMVFSGCNVENAAYPLGSCAEAGAIAAMVLAGESEIGELVVVTGGATPGTPCGGCRQRIREFARPDTLVHSTTTDSGLSTAIVMTVAELLPESFGPENILSDT